MGTVIGTTICGTRARPGVNGIYPTGLTCDEDNLDTGIPGWQVDVSFTYLKDENRGLEHRLDGLIVHGDQTIRTDQVEVENDQVIEYGVIEVAHRSDALGETFASTLAGTLANCIEVITPVVDNFEREHER